MGMSVSTRTPPRSSPLAPCVEGQREVRSETAPHTLGGGGGEGGMKAHDEVVLEKKKIYVKIVSPKPHTWPWKHFFYTYRTFILPYP